MNKLRLLLIVAFAVCLVQFNVITVPSRPPMYPHSAKYDVTTNVYLDYGMRSESWCRGWQDSSSPEVFRACVEPDRIPAKKKLVIKLRLGAFKDNDEWRYLAACGIANQRARSPKWSIGTDGGIRYAFDCEPPPFSPPGFRIVMHNGGQVVWNEKQVKLYPPHGDGLVRGFDLMAHVTKETPLNGTALEYLLGTRHLIPAQWDGRQVLFLGTILQHESGGYYAYLFPGSVQRPSAVLFPLDHLVHASSITAAVLV